MDYDEKRILDLEASVAQIKTLLQKLIGPEPEPEPESPEPEPEPIDMPFPAKPAPAEVPPPAILPMTRAEEIAEDKAERARLDSMPESKALLDLLENQVFPLLKRHGYAILREPPKTDPSGDGITLWVKSVGETAVTLQYHSEKKTDPRSGIHFGMLLQSQISGNREDISVEACLPENLLFVTRKNTGGMFDKDGVSDITRGWLG